ncbi:hypothetical protein OGAPHI_005649 [Ogataea philodendri]|uniref:N-acetylglucosaminylphosphatidylinositol deacetylase n=1 Tax=Ogataea philodendri TaxID=1378263 RepID=A0A9P8P045_9ASCO|nr:uncharacterized protein OGAPHI_005649 [Ogataea philodendri]KAH3662397.1 hypothetical protein OGAPHI_005649 [Ogataea philodendri]
MMLLKLPGKIVKKFVCSLFMWAILSTVVTEWLGAQKYRSSPYSQLYHLNQDTIQRNSLTDADVIFVTAHPDDESMFFSPTIVELAKPDYNNALHLVCFSNGNYDGLGSIREHELTRAAQILGFQSFEILDYTDDITKGWDSTAIASSLVSQLKSLPLSKPKKILITFDEEGVSGHINHKSLFDGVEAYSRKHSIRSFKLRSWSVFTKYSFFIVTNLELVARFIKKSALTLKYLPQLTKVLPNEESTIKIYANFNSWFLNLATMTYAHYSQIVWYRWLWIFFSRYMNCNELEIVT